MPEISGRLAGDWTGLGLVVQRYTLSLTMMKRTSIFPLHAFFVSHLSNVRHFFMRQIHLESLSDHDPEMTFQFPRSSLCAIGAWIPALE